MKLRMLEVGVCGTDIFLPGTGGRRPCHGTEERCAQDRYWKDLVLFYECFRGDNGRSVGAGRQTGWTALAACCIEDAALAHAKATRGGERG